MERIVRSVDFERVLASPIQARSAHFAVHFLDGRPSTGAKAAPAAVRSELSTAQALKQGKAVDDSAVACWLGAVVPKRHARRAVTRNLVKREIRCAAGAQPDLRAGLWVVRLRSPFDPLRFPSASSSALRDDVGRELSQLMADAARRAARG
ncbi:MAG: ribonuclease P protein component [Rhizobacter sp.]|nr:ribonuclease P protein component [Rhizobacter sp.]